MPAQAPISTTGKFSMAVASSISAAANANVILGRMKSSVLVPGFDEMNAGAEHGVNNATRATLQKSRSKRTAYMGSFSGSWFMYPRLIGVVLRGIGMKCTTTDGTGDAAGSYTHVFEIAERDDTEYVTVWQDVGDQDVDDADGDSDSSSVIKRRGVGGRVAQLGFIANSKGVLCSTNGIVADLDGPHSETPDIVEPEEPLLATAGTLAGNWAMDLTPGDGVTPVSYDSELIRSQRFTMTNPVMVDDAPLFSPERAALDQMGIAVNGVLGGIDMSNEKWNQFYREGNTSGSPQMDVPIASMTFKLQSADYISGVTTEIPYSIQFALPTIEMRLSGHQLQGRAPVRATLQWNMYDPSSTEPLTITLVNDVASYAGSSV